MKGDCFDKGGSLTSLKTSKPSCLQFLMLGRQNEISEWCLPGGQIIPTLHRSILHAANSSQRQYNVNIFVSAEGLN